MAMPVKRWTVGVVWLAVGTLVGAGASAVWGQAPGEAGRGEASMATAGQPAAGASAQPAPMPMNPIVEALRQANPQSPAELARATQIMLDAAEWAEAKSYVSKLMATLADDQTAFRLYRQFGLAFVLRLKHVKDIQPEGAQLAELIQGAVQRVTQDPAWLDQQLQQLQDPQRRLAAVASLREARATVWPVAVTVLADPSQQAKHRAVTDALHAIGPATVPALSAALESDDPAFVHRVALVLSGFSAPESLRAVMAVAYRRDLPAELAAELRERVAAKWGGTVSQEVVVRWLEKQFLQSFRSATRPEHDPLHTTETWVWDPAQRTISRLWLIQDDHQRWQALRYANDLYRIAPENATYRVYALAAQAEWLEARAALDESGTGAAAEPGAMDGAELIHRVLQFALDMRRSGAASWAARRLGQIGTVQLVESSSGRPSALVQALSYPDQHVQFAAAEAILRINPDRPFAGSARLREVLGYFLGGRSERRALVGNPLVEEAQSWAGFLRQMGFQVDIVATGRGVLDQLSRVPDYEFVLVVDRLGDPPAVEMIQLARNTPWAGQMRFAVLCQAASLEPLRLAMEDDPMVLVFPRVSRLETMQQVVGFLDELPGARPLQPENRTARLKLILDWLAARAAHPSAIDLELVRLEERVLDLAESPAVGQSACAILGGFGTARAQKRLVDIASQVAFPLELRQAAAAAFQQAVARRGVMLTSAEVLLQYDRYNASAALDKETQQVLAALLDTIEQSQAKGESR